MKFRPIIVKISNTDYTAIDPVDIESIDVSNSKLVIRKSTGIPIVINRDHYDYCSWEYLLKRLSSIFELECYEM